jgi:hypothetical protein
MLPAFHPWKIAAGDPSYALKPYSTTPRYGLKTREIKV